MLSTIWRRGPDGEGWHEPGGEGAPVVLGFRRLAIYDLTAASNQPMSRRVSAGDPGLHIVFNGAIYNFRALREELEAAGHVFHTHGDTEVLLAAWDHWGADCLARLDGMFAFVIHDARRRKLIVARDRFGEKPILWAKVRVGQDQGFAFASDVRQLLPFLTDGRALNEAATADFLNIGAVDFDDSTFFAGIQRVPAGCWAEFDLDPNAPPSREAFRPWTRFDAEAVAGDDLAERLRAALDEAVALRLAADVPVGSCLSGGLDSTLIVALAQRRLAERGAMGIHTVSAVYDEDEALSERPYLNAALAANDHPARLITPTGDDMLANLDAVIEAQGEPFAHSSVCLQWFVFRSAREEGLKVMLDGQGADELFGGYDHMIGHHLAERLAALDPLGALRSARAHASDGATFSTSALAKGALIRLAPEQALRGFARARGRYPPADWPMPGHEPALAPARPGHGLYDAMTQDLLTRASLPALLRYEDRNAMAHGVESRLPYLAPRVVDLALGMSSQIKMRDGWTKDILRRAAQGLIPDAITRRRRKLGFVTPQDGWMAGHWRPWALERLSEARARFDFLDSAALDRLEAQVGHRSEANAAAFRLAVFVSWSAMFDAGR
ncbi:asparagine synthase (glutamine-hydrolyzing) [Caulobacter soli]|uniref:asparagine synthase (glutamine-hydrolyzing) n=1 Tax=Caulobacter soli TaxID=2708539 RepID=UPI0013EBE385|nr:asparagine synthase (glutamine-hydrolyzing) [Caulobacter soli]